MVVSSMINWERLFKVSAIVVVLLFPFSCKTPQEKLEGQWEIVGYKDHKQDMLPILKKFYMHKECMFNFPDYPDPPSKDGFFSSGEHDLKDSLIWFQMGIHYDKPIIAFSKPFYYGISDWRNSLYLSQNDSTGYKDQIPVDLFEGKWRLDREGENRLELTRTGSKKIYMIFVRKN